MSYFSYLLLVLLDIAFAASNSYTSTTGTNTSSSSSFDVTSTITSQTVKNSSANVSGQPAISLQRLNGTTSVWLAVYTTSTSASQSLSSDIATVSALQSTSLFLNPTLDFAIGPSPLETSTSTPISLGLATSTFVTAQESPFANPLTREGIIFGVGVGVGLFVALLIAISTVLVLLCRRRKKSGKLVLQRGSQVLCASGTINRESYANTIFDKTITSTARSTACAFGDKSDYVIETSENAAYNAPYASKSASMESLGSISDQDVSMQELVVPTQGQRKNIAENIIKGSSRHLYTILKNQQKALINILAKEGVGSDDFWRPSFVHEDLYQQMFENKYVEIPRNKIKILSYLRSETFGIVNKGLWHSSTGLKEVAVRLLPEGASLDEEVTFLQEAVINGQFSDHPNIVHLYGMATLRNPILIVMEFLENDIKTYLTTQRTIPSARTLLSFCQQVANGMKFLSDRKFVHRHLMAQNIFLAENGVCKIGSFGTSLLLETEDLRISHGISIPTRWAAPEVIHSRKYSSSSDVWSYGVVMYEIWSLGRTPYEQLPDQEVIKAVDSGTRLDSPPECPQPVYKIMTECWYSNSENRPSFGTVYMQLSSVCSSWNNH